VRSGQAGRHARLVATNPDKGPRYTSQKMRGRLVAVIRSHFSVASIDDPVYLSLPLQERGGLTAFEQ
jgi:hypothetical protein